MTIVDNSTREVISNKLDIPIPSDRLIIGMQLTIKKREYVAVAYYPDSNGGILEVLTSEDFDNMLSRSLAQSVNKIIEEDNNHEITNK